MNLNEVVRDYEDKPIVKNLEFSKTLKFKTEVEMIGWIKEFKLNEDRLTLKSRWDLGTVITRFYDKKYGQDKLQKISDEVGYSKSTLHKACQFVRKFTVEHLKALMEGPVMLSWRDVAQNLSVAPEDFIKTYRDSKTLHEFRNAVTKFKLHGEVRGKMKPKPQSFKNNINFEYQLLMRNQVEYRDWQIREKDNQIAKLMDQAKQKDEQIFRLKKMLTQPEKKRQDVESLNQENDAEVPQLLMAVN